MVLTKHPSRGVSLQNNMQEEGEKLLHLSHLLEIALNELDKCQIEEVRYTHF